MIKKKNTLSTYLLYALYFLYFIPGVIAEASDFIHIPVVLLQSAGCVFCFVLFLMRIKQASKPMLFLSATIALSAIVTLVSRFSVSDLVRWFAIYKDIFSIAFLTEWLYRENPGRYRKLVENVMTAGLVLNVVSVAFFPSGLVQMTNEAGVTYPNFFYDYDNRFLTRYVLTFALNYMNDQNRKIKITLPAMLLGLLSVVLTGAVMSVVAMGVMILGYLVMKFIPQKVLNIRNVWFLYIVAACAVVAFSFTEAFASLADMVGKNNSLIVRTRMWETAIPMILEKPIFGTGIMDTTGMRTYFRYATLHNTLLNTLLWSGVAGFALYTLYVWFVSGLSVKNAADNIVKYFAVLFGGIMVLCLMDCIETSPYVYGFFMLAANHKDPITDGSAPTLQK